MIKLRLARAKNVGRGAKEELDRHIKELLKGKHFISPSHLKGILNDAYQLLERVHEWLTYQSAEKLLEIDHRAISGDFIKSALDVEFEVMQVCDLRALEYGLE